MGKIVKFVHRGNEYEMEEEQIEAAYRFRERQYRYEDAKRHLIMEANEYANDIEELSLEDKVEFCSKFDIDIMEAMKLLELIVDEFELRYDCNTPENAAWDSAIQSILG